MTTFAYVLAPGRFDATPNEAKAAWDEYRSLGEIITATEYGSGKFDVALTAPGWDHIRAEGVIAWATDTFEPAWRGAGHSERIGTPFYRGGNRNARTPLTSMPLRHIATGKVIMVRVCHMPAHIQAGNGFRRTTPRVIAQAAAWSSALATWGRRSRRFKRGHPKAAELSAGDFNADMHRRHWRTLVARVLGLRCVKPLVKGGDLGKRLISWGFVRGLEVESTRLLRKQDGFDHLASVTHLVIKE